MKVFIVVCSWDYDGSEVFAVCKTREDAEAVVQKLRDKEMARDRQDIQEWEVGEVLKWIDE
jgi:hypothetical protein